MIAQTSLEIIFLSNAIGIAIGLWYCGDKAINECFEKWSWNE